MDYGTHHGFKLNYTEVVVDQISSGQVVESSEQDFGRMNYKGKCPVSIASLIKMQNSKGNTQLSRVTDLQVEFKDNQYQVTGISLPKDELNQTFYTAQTNNENSANPTAITGAQTTA